MIEKVVHEILRRKEALAREPFEAQVPNSELFVRNYWRSQGLQAALDVINDILRKDVDDVDSK